ncbi:hypothetical protein NIES2104_56140 [Leptolyngbya sp. NIES-2104]|nr:hypothetical protein NIES2104_56140 [Leptolyngbya sp. NIES-2104]
MQAVNSVFWAFPWQDVLNGLQESTWSDRSASVVEDYNTDNASN